MKIDRYLEGMIERDASDLFLRGGSNPKVRVYGEVVDLDNSYIEAGEMLFLIKEIVSEEKMHELYENKNYEGAFYFRDHWRFRVSVFFQRNSLALVIRKIDLRIEDFNSLNLPGEVLGPLCQERRGLVLLTGTTGSGKSTTIASMIEYINNHYKRHILSIEEPIEFTFEDKKSIINQREIGKDVKNYPDALRQFSLHSPDVLFIGNMRDGETMRAALDAAETGVLVFSTIHSVNASQTVERIMSFFAPYQHKQVLLQLSQLLKGVISLRLIPEKGQKGLFPIYEVMTLTPTISRLLRDFNIKDIPKYIEEGSVYGMVSFEQKLLEVVRSGKITTETAIDFSERKEELKMKIQHNL